VDLHSPDGTPLPLWQPGAHIELRLNVAGEELRRQYSLCGGLGDATLLRLAVLREENGRGGSAYIHDAVEVGEVLPFVGPRNHFQLRPSRRYVSVAGGIGVTPILPMARTLAARNGTWQLIYCARAQDRVVFADELSALPRENVTIHVDERDGLLDIDELVHDLDSDTAVYACGPVGLLRAFESRAEQGASWRYFSEQFVPTR
jgi:ferredoxin-NADP reductase